MARHSLHPPTVPRIDTVDAVGVDRGDRWRPVPAVAPLSTELDVLEEGTMVDTMAALHTGQRIANTAQARGDPIRSARARLVQADMLDRQGQTTTGIRILREVRAWAESNDCRQVLARCHLLLLRVHHHLGDLAACLEHAVSAVELLEEDAPLSRRALYLAKLADALAWTGSFDAARDRYREAEQLAVAAGDRRRQLMVLNNRAYAEYEAGEPERAWKLARRMSALAASDETELPPGMLDTIARIQIALGRYDDAEQTTRRAIDGYTRQGGEEADALARYLLTLAIAQRHRGAVRSAHQDLDRSQALVESRGLAAIRIQVLAERAEVYAAEGDFPRAFHTLKALRAADLALRSVQREAQARTRQAIFETNEARREAERFRILARSDPLTGLPNRRYVDEELPALIARAAAGGGGGGGPLTVALADLDHFKQINDALSHEVGDQVIRTVGELLQAGLAGICPAAFAARIGGEEFLIVLPGLTPAQAAGHLDRLRARVRAHAWTPITRGHPVTISMGVAGIGAGSGGAGNAGAGGTTATRKSLLASADACLYAAKRAGRDRVVTSARQDRG